MCHWFLQFFSVNLTLYAFLQNVYYWFAIQVKGKNFSNQWKAALQYSNFIVKCTETWTHHLQDFNQFQRIVMWGFWAAFFKREHVIRQISAHAVYFLQNIELKRADISTRVWKFIFFRTKKLICNWYCLSTFLKLQFCSWNFFLNSIFL